jgi:hypothetical protein
MLVMLVVGIHCYVNAGYDSGGHAMWVRHYLGLKSTILHAYRYAGYVSVLP